MTAVSTRYDRELLAEIRRIGFHPFILVRTVDDSVGNRHIACLTQNEAGEFVQQLAALPHFAEGKLVRAIERALQLKPGESADLLFAWIHEPVSAITETAFVGLPDDAELECFYGYPAYALSAVASCGDQMARIQLLREIFDAYAGTDGNNALRFAIMEALALALARALGHPNSRADALAIIDPAQIANRTSIDARAHSTVHPIRTQPGNSGAREVHEKQAVVFVTHTQNSEIGRHFARLQSEVAGLVDVFVCLDASDPTQPCEPNFPVDFRIAREDAARVLPRRYQESRERTGGLLNGGYTDLAYWPALMDDRLASYKYLWILEYDVDYSGDWRDFFTRTMPSSADLLGTTIFPRTQSKDWVFWESFRSPPEVPFEAQLRSFIPIARFSRRMLEVYTDAVSDSRWGGHTEALFPTIAHFNQLRVEDLGGEGPFCPPEWRSKNYVNTPLDAKLSPGTFVYRPATHSYYHDTPQEFSRRDFLYHPVKTRAACRC